MYKYRCNGDPGRERRSGKRILRCRREKSAAIYALARKGREEKKMV